MIHLRRITFGNSVARPVLATFLTTSPSMSSHSGRQQGECPTDSGYTIRCIAALVINSKLYYDITSEYVYFLADFSFHIAKNIIGIVSRLCLD